LFDLEDEIDYLDTAIEEVQSRDDTLKDRKSEWEQEQETLRKELAALKKDNDKIKAETLALEKKTAAQSSSPKTQRNSRQHSPPQFTINELNLLEVRSSHVEQDARDEFIKQFCRDYSADPWLLNLLTEPSTSFNLRETFEIYKVPDVNEIAVSPTGQGIIWISGTQTLNSFSFSNPIPRKAHTTTFPMDEIVYCRNPNYAIGTSSRHLSYIPLNKNSITFNWAKQYGKVIPFCSEKSVKSFNMSDQHLYSFETQADEHDKKGILQAATDLKFLGDGTLIRMDGKNLSIHGVSGSHISIGEVDKWGVFPGAAFANKFYAIKGAKVTLLHTQTVKKGEGDDAPESLAIVKSMAHVFNTNVSSIIPIIGMSKKAGIVYLEDQSYRLWIPEDDKISEPTQFEGAPLIANAHDLLTRTSSGFNLYHLQSPKLNSEKGLKKLFYKAKLGGKEISLIKEIERDLKVKLNFISFPEEGSQQFLALKGTRVEVWSASPLKRLAILGNSPKGTTKVVYHKERNTILTQDKEDNSSLFNL
ncbi:MAG: hypothetical protein HQL32_10820, partial [Planctomycetes bacterium]|nr:hypothetical protein [Planctomycetota bacterium]